MAAGEVLWAPAADAWAPTLAPDEFAPIDGPFKPQAEQMRAVKDGTLDATVVERDRKAVARLGVQLGVVAAAAGGALEDALGEGRLDERHASAPRGRRAPRGPAVDCDSSTSSTIRSATASSRS